jgi:hypothetical protein
VDSISECIPTKGIMENHAELMEIQLGHPKPQFWTSVTVVTITRPNAGLPPPMYKSHTVLGIGLAQTVYIMRYSTVHIRNIQI